MGIIQTFKTYSGFNLIKNGTKSIIINKEANISFYDFLKVFWIRVMKGNFPLRSAAVSWIIFFSMFPFLLFLFSVLPHVPHYIEIKNLIFKQFLPQLLPLDIKNDVIAYIESTTEFQKNRNIDWYLILVTIFMSSNGIQGIISSFNVSYHNVYEIRRNSRSRIISIVLTLFFTLFIILQVVLSYYTSVIWKYLTNVHFLSVLGQFSFLINYFSIFVFYFISMCMLYTFGPNHRKTKSTIFPGAILTSILFVLTVLGFNFYLRRFTNIDLMYGSLGLVMIMMIFVYVNVILMLIGYELNMSVIYTKNYNKLDEIMVEKKIKLEKEG